MTVSVVGSASVGNTNNTDVTSVVCNKPGSTASGDFMVAVFTAPYTGSLTYTPPSGWTLVDSQNGGGSVSLWSGLYTKTAGGSEPSTYTWQCSGAGSMTVGIITYRGTDGTFNSTSSSNPRKNSGTTTNPNLPSPLTSITGTGLTTFASSWHATGGTGVTSSGSASQASTERWDISRTDGSPSTHERGSSAYTLDAEFTSGSNNPTSPSVTLSASPTSYVNWTWGLNSVVSGAGASTVPHFGSALTGTVAAAPEGPIASTIPHFGSALTGYVVPKGPIASTMPHFGSSFTGKVTGVRVEMLINGVWTDITEYVRYKEGVSITRGGSAESTTMTTGLCNMTLDNREDTAQSRFSQQNPLSPYYGYIGRNTQIRVTKVEATGYRFWGEISSWEPGADDTDTDRYVAIEASGLVRRLEAVASPLFPAVQREIANLSPIDYWPCDEQKGATQISSALKTGARISVKGTPDYASYSNLKCSGAMPQIGSSVWSSPILKNIDYTNGMTLTFLMSIPENGIASNSTILRLPYYYTETAFPDGATGYLNFEMLSTGDLYANGFPLSGSAGAATDTVPLVGTNGVMIYLGIKRASSSSFNFGLWYQGENDASPVLVGTSTWNTGAGGAIGSGAFKSFVFNPDQLSFGTTASVYLGHIAQWNGYGPGDDDVPSFASVGAYSGEPAGTRFERICTEEGIDVTVNNPSDSSAMGPQTAKTTVALLRECEATDLGVMYEKRDGLGLGYIVRRDLYNTDADLTLDYSNGELDGQLKPVYDDKNVQNDVTVQRNGGSSARYEVTTGSMSVNDPPGGAGRYDTSVTVSLDDDSKCYAQAGWRARLGTVEGARVTSVAIELANKRFADNVSLSNDAYSVDSGSKITITNPPEWAGQEFSQIVRGYSERFTALTHEITFNTAPASPYDTAVAVVTPTTTTSKADSLTSTLHTDIDEDDTSLVVDVTGVTWRSQGIPIALFDSCDTIDVSKWTIDGGSGLTANGQWTFATTLGGSYTTATSATTYDLTGKYHSLQLVSAGNQALASLEVFACQLYKDSNNSVSFYINDGHIFALHRASGSTTISGSTTYNSTTHQWLRIREQGGTTYWDTSPNGITWTNFYSISNPFAVTALEAMPSVGTYDTEASTTTVVMDNIDLSSRPFDIIVGGERMTVTAVSGTSSPQTFTVTRAVNGITKSHTAGAQIRLWQPAIVGL